MDAPNLIFDDGEGDGSSPEGTGGEQFDLTELGLRLRNYVVQAMSAKGGLPNTWEEIFRSYRDEMPDYEVVQDEGESPTHISILGPRIDTLATETSQIVLDQEPYMLCENMGDEDVSNAIEKLIHRNWEEGGLETSVQAGAIIAGVTNFWFHKVSMFLSLEGLVDENADQVQRRPKGFVRYAGLKIDGVHPYDFFIAPITVDGVQSAAIVGHRFWQSKESIVERQALGLYQQSGDVDLMMASDSPIQTEHAAAFYYSMVSPQIYSQDPAANLVECCEMYFREKEKFTDKTARWYRAEIALRASFVLKVENWNHSRPPYFRSTFLPVITNYWDGRSPGRKLIPVQSEEDRVHSRIYNSSMESSQPPIFAWGVDKEEYSQAGAGSLIEMEPGSPPPWSPTINVETEGLLQQEQRLMQVADSIVQVSTNSMGQEEPGKVTATQSQSINQGASNRLSAYVRSFTREWPAMAAFSCELLYDNWALWRPFYDDDDDIMAVLRDRREDLIAPKTWRVNGTGPQSTPAARRAAIAQVMAMAKDPNTMIDTYEVAKSYMRYSGIPGARKWQKERPVENPNQGSLGGNPAAPQGPVPVMPSAPGAMAPHTSPPSAGVPHGVSNIGNEPGHDPSVAGSAAADLRAAGG